MKKIIAGLALALITSVSYAKPFQCTGYTDAAVIEPSITVNASKAAVAETKAKDRMRKKGIEVAYVKCK